MQKNSENGGFLEDVAKYAINTYGDELKDCQIVLPNNRAIIFFKKYLSQFAHKPIWSPQHYTISEFVRELSHFQLADELYLLFTLYQTFRKHTGTTETFDEFYYWGGMLLSDFNDIDKYLVNAKDIFQNLASLKEIEERLFYLSPEQIETIRHFWTNFNPKKDKQHQQDFLDTWKILYPVYHDFRTQLKTNDATYEGMIYRDVVEKIANQESLPFQGKKAMFVGFNALSKSEEKIFKHFRDNGTGEFFWDYDEYYINNPYHEAGFFLRENLQKFPSPEFKQETKMIFNSEKKVRVISVSSEIGQVKLLGEILPGISDEKKGKNITPSTAIVMADESLLVPALYSIPGHIKELNITMGYPFRSSPVYEMIQLLVELQRNARIYKAGNMARFYHRDVLALLSQSYIANIMGEKANDITIKINKHNLILIDESEFSAYPLMKDIFHKIYDYEDFTSYLLRILQNIHQHYSENEKEQLDQYKIHQEFVFQAFLQVKRLNEILLKYAIKPELNTYFKILSKHLQQCIIPFVGEPLSEVQIMGLLETRTLDFKNLIILSMNEGIIPKKNAAYSYIPYNLRKGFGLPTHEHQDAIFAYYFYRLIQRADNITLVYNSKTEGMKRGEKSRYINQLQFESDLHFFNEKCSFKIHGNNSPAILIKKDNKVLNELATFFSDAEPERFLSPSALNSFLDCSLRFYFSHVAGMRETDQVEEEVDALLFGNILHKAMQLIYDPLRNKELQMKDIESLLGNSNKIDQILDDAFNEEYFKNTSGKQREITGKNVIIKEIIKKYIVQILKIDKERTPFVIVSLENTYKLNRPVFSGNQKKTIRIGGNIDRIDLKEGVYHIIDYKTGTIERVFKKLEDLTDQSLKKRNKAAFQVFVYAKLFYTHNEGKGAVQPGLFTTVDLFSDSYTLEIFAGSKKNPVKDYSGWDKEFTEQLQKVIDEIYDPETVFSQTEDTDKCKNCPYIEICHR